MVADSGRFNTFQQSDNLIHSPIRHFQASLLATLSGMSSEVAILLVSTVPPAAAGRVAHHHSLNHIHCVVLTAVLSPLCRSRISPYAMYSGMEAASGIDATNEPLLRNAIREVIRPHYLSFDAWSRNVIAESVLYVVYTDTHFADTVFDDLPVPARSAQDVRKFFLILADELEIDMAGGETSTRGPSKNEDRVYLRHCDNRAAYFPVW